MSSCVDTAAYLPAAVNERVATADEPHDVFTTDTTQSMANTAVTATQHQWTGAS